MKFDFTVVFWPLLFGFVLISMIRYKFNYDSHTIEPALSQKQTKIGRSTDLLNLMLGNSLIVAGLRER